MKQLSLVIPHYNDVATTIGTLDSLYSTIDIDMDKFEVIVVDDGSQEKIPSDYKWCPNASYVHHFTNLGVGQAFDLGVRLASAENIILMGADIRFKNNGWASRMLKVIDKEPEALIATACGSTINESKHYCGADVIFKLSAEQLSDNHPRKGVQNYKAVFEGKWRGQTGRGVYPVPSLMGAFYGVKKRWYEYIRGFELHYIWGSLEPYISLKSWILGGKVLVDTENKTYHMWRTPQRSARFDALMYNQILISSVVMYNYGKKYVDYLYDRHSSTYIIASDIARNRQAEIAYLAEYIKDRRVMEPKELEELMVNMSVEYNKETRFPNPLDEVESEEKYHFN